MILKIDMLLFGHEIFDYWIEILYSDYHNTVSQCYRFHKFIGQFFKSDNFLMIEPQQQQCILNDQLWIKKQHIVKMSSN